MPVAIFSSITFKHQVAAGALNWCITRNNGAGIKLHPCKTDIRNGMIQYKKMRIHNNAGQTPVSRLTTHLQSILDLYLSNWDTSSVTLCKRYLSSHIDLQQNNAVNMETQCVVCLDDIHVHNNDMMDSSLILCSGPAGHIYHRECYLEFLKSEETKDLDKKYKCERDTLCIACYQPMCL